jgi:hypothetical protein
MLPPGATEFKGRENEYFEFKHFILPSTNFKLLSQIKGDIP